MRVGIVGGGQLGRMLALAAYPLGLTVTVLDSSADAPAGAVAPLVVGDLNDPAALARLADAADIVTFDFENVPAEAADWLATRCEVRPAPRALRAAQDRVAEKTLFQHLRIPVAAFAAVDDEASLEQALDRIGVPAVLKTRRLGYDGKGQRVIRTRAEAARARVDLGGSALILETFVEFVRELSVVAVRGMDGTVACYPLVENIHRDGILRSTRAPATSPFASQADAYVVRLMEHLDYVGVIALELFECADGLFANEFAPRVHNTGHWTLEGAVTDQFENHLRAITGLPLGGTAAHGDAAMVNFIGRMPDPAAVLALPGTHLHDYGKAARAGRKLGHATVTGADSETVAATFERLRALADC